jgi:hypothetical protein
MPTDKRRLKVFLCHASADKPKVRELYRYLNQRAIKPWFDEEDLIGGQDWQVEIPKAIRICDAVIICLTKNSVNKEGYVQKEIKFALDKAFEIPEGRTFLIPVRFEDCDVPSSLSRYQWVDLFDTTGYSKLIRALNFRAAQLEDVIDEILEKDTGVEKPVLEEDREATEETPKDKAERDITEKSVKYPMARIRGMQQFMEFTREPHWKPSLVDVSLLKKLGMATSKEREVIQTLRFLGVINNAGIPTKEFGNLQRDYRGTMKRLVQEQYQDLFKLLPVNQINQSNLVKFFGPSVEASEYRAKLFIWLCKQGGIELSNLDKRY